MVPATTKKPKAKHKPGRTAKSSKQAASKGAAIPAAKAKKPAKARAIADLESDAIEAPDRSAPPLAEVDAAALEFIEAIDRFKKQHGRPFPSWSEVLMVLRDLGYSRP
jgi:hypothetical protein